MKCAVADKKEPLEALVERRGRVVVSFANVRRASGSMQTAQVPRTEHGDMVERAGHSFEGPLALPLSIGSRSDTGCCNVVICDYKCSQ